MLLTAERGVENPHERGYLGICLPYRIGRGMMGQVVHGFEIQVGHRYVAYTGYPTPCSCGKGPINVPENQQKCWIKHLSLKDQETCNSCSTGGLMPIKKLKY